jgi:tRNA A37 threonylcarbamoyladenosine synthetase subunit TsaC/SUA5/YrdC
LGNPDDVAEFYERGLSILLDGGTIDAEGSTVLSLVDGAPELLRPGRGPTEGIL